MANRSALSFAVVAAIIFSSIIDVTDSQFSINYTDDSFYMDGKPFRYVSGSMHYFRVPRPYWRDRLRKIRAAGLNAVTTYVEWSLHEKKPGVYDFAGELDVEHFIKLAQEERLYVILRPGPYICAERDMGGLPYWLLKYPNIYLRTADEEYTKHVQDWMNVLMTKMAPLLYGRGGPIIMVQVENEYGSYVACDHEHSIWLRDLFRKYVREDAVLFTTDGVSANLLKCGKIPGVYATVDYGPTYDVEKAIRIQRQFEPRGPLVNSEFYSGWLTHWGQKMARTPTPVLVKSLRTLLTNGVNVNFYMFHGGTNFGFTAGANFEETYTPDITSYDYDAPITEAGDLTEKYFAIRDVIHEFFQPDENVTVSTAEKGNYGEVQLLAVANFLSPLFKQLFGVQHRGSSPLSFEALDQSFGYLLYETEIGFGTDRDYLSVPILKDLGNVYVNGVYQGTLSREQNIRKLMLRNICAGDKLSIAVESMGRINFGSHLNDTKGILSEVYLGSRALESWSMTSFQLDNMAALEGCYEANDMDERCLNGEGFTFYVGTFATKEKTSPDGYPLDTYINVSHLMKGIVFVNNFMLGRYWSVRGPQYTLYVPGVYLKPYPQQNVIVVMDEYISSASIKVSFSKRPIFKY